MINLGELIAGIIFLIIGLWVFFNSSKYVAGIASRWLPKKFSDYEISFMKILWKFGAILFMVFGVLAIFGLLR